MPAEKKVFAFKRDPELDFLLKRKAKIATVGVHKLCEL